MAHSGKGYFNYYLCQLPTNFFSPLQWIASACLDQSFMLGRTQEYGNHLFSPKLLSNKFCFQICFKAWHIWLPNLLSTTTPCTFGTSQHRKSGRTLLCFAKEWSQVDFSISIPTLHPLFYFKGSHTLTVFVFFSDIFWISKIVIQCPKKITDLFFGKMIGLIFFTLKLFWKQFFQKSQAQQDSTSQVLALIERFVRPMRNQVWYNRALENHVSFKTFLENSVGKI